MTTVPKLESRDSRAVLEYRHEVLKSLNKLGDKATIQTGATELADMVAELTDASLPVYLSCLFDTNDSQVIFAKRESVRLFGVLASVHRETLRPHLKKMLDVIVRRLRENDTALRDFCADTAGVLVRFCADENTLPIFFKAFFGSISEQNKNVQEGCSRCLAKVFYNSGSLIEAELPKLCPRLLKQFTMGNFQARASLFSAVANLVQAAGDSLVPYLQNFLQVMMDGLSASDWGERKAAAEALEAVAGHMGRHVNPMRKSVIEALEGARFDKIRPVRDEVAQVLALWRELPLKYGGAVNDTPPAKRPTSALPPVRPGSSRVRSAAKRAPDALISSKPSEEEHVYDDDGSGTRAGIGTRESRAQLAKEASKGEFFVLVKTTSRQNSVQNLVPGEKPQRSEPTENTDTQLVQNLLRKLTEQHTQLSEMLEEFTISTRRSLGALERRVQEAEELVQAVHGGAPKEGTKAGSVWHSHPVALVETTDSKDDGEEEEEEEEEEQEEIRATPAAPTDALTSLMNKLPGGGALRFCRQNLTSTLVDFEGSGSSVAEIDFSQNSIEIVEGLHRFPNLQRVNLKHNELSSVEGIQEAQRLRWLDVSFNKLRTAEGLLECRSLTELHLENNSLSDAREVTPLVNLRELTYLNLNGNLFDAEAVDTIKSHFEERLPSCVVRLRKP